MEVITNLLDKNDLSPKFLFQELIKLKQCDFADLYLAEMITESWVIDEGIIKSGSFVLNQGIGVRGVSAEKTFFSHANSLNPKVITSLVDNLYTETTPQKACIIYPANNNSAHQLYGANNPLQEWENAKKIKLLQDCDRYLRAKEKVHNVIISLNLEYEQIAIVKSASHQLATDIRPLIHISVSVIVNAQGKLERGSSGGGGRYRLNYFNLEQVFSYADKAYNQALLKLEAKAAPSGEMPVVLANGWAGVILHEAVGHGLEGDFNRKGSSAFSGKIGEKVASSAVTVIDDGTIYNRRGSLNIDDEGNPTQKNVLIENGVLKNYLFDELNARLMNTTSSGNGRRESYASTPLPRMTNTFMLNGSYSPAEIISSVDYGLYAENFEGGQVDITSGQFVFNASIAWVIEKGRLSYPVKGSALVGSGPECLKHVTMVANDLELDPGVGMCGKEGQSVPVGVGQPTIRLDGGLVVGGAT